MLGIASTHLSSGEIPTGLCLGAIAGIADYARNRVESLTIRRNPDRSQCHPDDSEGFFSWDSSTGLYSTAVMRARSIPKIGETLHCSVQDRKARSTVTASL